MASSDSTWYSDMTGIEFVDIAFWRVFQRPFADGEGGGHQQYGGQGQEGMGGNRPDENGTTATGRSEAAAAVARSADHRFFSCRGSGKTKNPALPNMVFKPSLLRCWMISPAIGCASP